ncbi:MAG: hypothetical protein HW380_3156 [Magnetococcales bacterium]|nr:hypothetical protein [Magnetococcales bacterium]HIJ84378.1 ABC transporter permease [Magnetococcales bacterium]
MVIQGPVDHGRVMMVIAVMTVRENWRNRLPWAVLMVLGAGEILGLFLGSVAVTETEMVQGAVTGAFLRFGAVFLLSVAVIAGMAREFGDRMVEMILALAIPRAVYHLGKLTGFVLTAIPITVVSGLALIPYAPWDQVVLWSLSLGCELVLMAALGVLLVLTLTHVTLALTGAMAVYLLARSASTLVLVASGPFAQVTPMLGKWTLPILEFISWLLPDLGRFTCSEWLAYHTGRWTDMRTVLLETMVTLFFLCGAGLFDLYRKNL